MDIELDKPYNEPLADINRKFNPGSEYREVDPEGGYLTDPKWKKLTATHSSPTVTGYTPIRGTPSNTNSFSETLEKIKSWLIERKIANIPNGVWIGGIAAIGVIIAIAKSKGGE